MSDHELAQAIAYALDKSNRSAARGAILKARMKEVADSEQRRRHGGYKLFRPEDKRWLRKERKRLRGIYLNDMGYKGRPKAPVKLTPPKPGRWR